MAYRQFSEARFMVFAHDYQLHPYRYAPRFTPALAKPKGGGMKKQLLPRRDKLVFSIGLSCFAISSVVGTLFDDATNHWLKVVKAGTALSGLALLAVYVAIVSHER